MSKDAYITWYKAGSHAVRSACEQGEAGALKAHDLLTDPDAKAIAAEGAAMSKRHQESFVGILKDLAETPNDFVDRIMEGIGKGVEMSIEATQDKSVLDVALITGGQTALHYFIAGYGAHAGAAKALGMPQHAEMLKGMIDECKALDERYTQVAERSVNAKAAEA